MVRPRYQRYFILLIGTVWLVLGTSYITFNVIVMHWERTVHAHGYVLHTEPTIMHSSHILDDAESIDFRINYHGDYKMLLNQDQETTTREAQESKDDTQPPDNTGDTDDIDETEDRNEYREYSDIKVDSFCDAFEKHYRGNNSKSKFFLSGNNEHFQSFVERLDMYKRQGKPLLEPIQGLEKIGNESSWLLFYHEISRYSLYDPKSSTVAQLLEDLATNPVKSIVNFDKGTQIKLLLTLDDGAIALFKPMRFPRDRETLPDHFYFNDFERHIAEIAAFHLDRTTYSITAENMCFYGECDMYCDSNFPICGDPDHVEASFQILLPRNGTATLEHENHPWTRTYDTKLLAVWEYENDYCDQVRNETVYKTGRRLLDLMDVAVFDFLIGNMDRHDTDQFQKFGSDSTPIWFDNGRGFGKSREDEMSILTPIVQCCQIRLSTLAKLVKLYRGPDKLSQLMRTSLEADPLKSVLTEPHLDALDRRIVAILNVVRECVDEIRTFDTVVIDDGH